MQEYYTTQNFVDITTVTRYCPVRFILAERFSGALISTEGLGDESFSAGGGDAATYG